MWVFCGGMFRSGSTLQYQIGSHLAEALGAGRRVTWHSAEDFDQVREAHREQHDRLLVFKAHRLSDSIRRELQEQGGRVITVHRDIRDVVVSAMKKNGWTFKHIWTSANLAKWTRHFDDWAELPNALVSRYDIMISHIEDETRRIGDHLGLQASEELVCEIGREYSLENQKQRVQAVSQQRERGEVEKFDSHSLLHHNHIASGDVGVYRSVLKPFEIRAIESECQAWMQRWNYPPAEISLGMLDRLHGWMLRGAAS